MKRLVGFGLAAVAALVFWDVNVAQAQDHTVYTDADATVRVICRNDRSEDECIATRGLDPYIRVHDQNALDTGYFHFDLSDIDASSEIAEAKFQLDSRTNSWGDTAVTVVAIMDADQDWDLNALPEDQINVETAPYSDWETYAWTGDDLNDGQQRFNAPTPFLDEGESANAPVRALIPFPDYVFIENQDPLTDDVGNDYGGYAGADGPGTGGSADNGDNAWPVKDAVDLDITNLVKWKLGQNPTYSDFEPKDRDLTIMVRTEIGIGDNGFVRFISRESVDDPTIDLEPPNEDPLAEARIALSGNIIIGGGGGSPLWAGDADQDLDFDQLDLVKVQVAAKYLTGQPATWGEGDWNGAPGGEVGNPPAGNGLFDQLDIIAALAPGHYLTGPYGAIAGGGSSGDEQTSITYNPETGELGVDAPASTELTSINIDSASGIFTGNPAENLGGSFDNDADNNIFKATFGSSFGSLSFGNVAQAGLSEDFVMNDLTVVGSLAGGGDLGNVDLIYIPEPSTLVLLGLAVVGMVFLRRRR